MNVQLHGKSSRYICFAIGALLLLLSLIGFSRQSSVKEDQAKVVKIVKISENRETVRNGNDGGIDKLITYDAVCDIETLGLSTEHPEQTRIVVNRRFEDNLPNEGDVIKVSKHNGEWSEHQPKHAFIGNFLMMLIGGFMIWGGVVGKIEDKNKEISNI